MRFYIEEVLFVEINIVNLVIIIESKADIPFFRYFGQNAI